MFDLVADVATYPDFLPWCIALRVIDRSAEGDEQRLTADMVVAYTVFREKFRSKVVMRRAAGAIDAQYVDGPFRTLKNSWRFRDRPEGGSDVEFDIEFEFRSFLLHATAMTVFEKAFARMSEAFVARAHEVYGGATATATSHASREI
jgi:coenzyme Q-binding protein COQ10